MIVTVCFTVYKYDRFILLFPNNSLILSGTTDGDGQTYYTFKMVIFSHFMSKPGIILSGLWALSPGWAIQYVHHFLSLFVPVGSLCISLYMPLICASPIMMTSHSCPKYPLRAVVGFAQIFLSGTAYAFGSGGHLWDVRIWTIPWKSGNSLSDLGCICTS